MQALDQLSSASSPDFATLNGVDIDVAGGRLSHLNIVNNGGTAAVIVRESRAPSYPTDGRILFETAAQGSFDFSDPILFDGKLNVAMTTAKVIPYLG